MESICHVACVLKLILIYFEAKLNVRFISIFIVIIFVFCLFVCFCCTVLCLIQCKCKSKLKKNKKYGLVKTGQGSKINFLPDLPMLSK